MFSKLMPRSAQFFDIFENHAALLVQAAEKYHSDLSSEKGIQDLSEIKNLEHQADVLTQSCVESLHKTFITPFDRDQIFSLIKALDDILDCIDGAADKLIIYRIHVVRPDFVSLTNILVQAVYQVERGVKGLRSMGDFAANTKIHQDIHRLEHEADVVLAQALGRLFDEEPDTRQIIKWKELYDLIEEAVDTCAHVADIMEGIFLENV